MTKCIKGLMMMHSKCKIYNQISNHSLTNFLIMTFIVIKLIYIDIT